MPPFDTKEQEIVAIKKAKNGDNAAKEEIVLRSVRLVYSIAKRYCSEGISMEDLIQEGIEGILYDRAGNVLVYPAGREEDV